MAEKREQDRMVAISVSVTIEQRDYVKGLGLRMSPVVRDIISEHRAKVRKLTTRQAIEPVEGELVPLRLTVRRKDREYLSRLAPGQMSHGLRRILEWHMTK